MRNRPVAIRWATLAALTLPALLAGCGPEVIIGQRPAVAWPVVCLGVLGEPGWRPTPEADAERPDIEWYRASGTVVAEEALDFAVTWNLWDCAAVQRRPGFSATFLTEAGQYWRVGFGIRDFGTLEDRTPQLPVGPGTTLSIAAAESAPGSNALVLRDGLGLVLAADELTGALLASELREPAGTPGGMGPAEPTPLTVRRGEPDGPAYEDPCGRTRPTPVVFEGDETVSVAPGERASFTAGGTALSGYAGPAYLVLEAQCTDMESTLPYAVHRSGG